MAVNNKQIREQCDEMSSGWEQSLDTEFNGFRKAGFDADRIAARTIEDEIDSDEAAVKAKKKRRDDMYRKLDADRVKIGKGVAGHKDFGDDHPIYGAMGFVRKSERKSGLKRNKKNGGGTGDGENK